MRTRELFSQESGAAIVELAFTLPMFVILMLGTAEIANIAWASVQLNNAAHAGAQFGSLNRANAADTTDIQTAAQNEAPTLITAPTTQVASTLACSCVTPSTGSETAYSCGTVQANCASPNVILVSIQVTAQAAVSPLIRYPHLPASYTLHAQAKMGILQ
jgi:Flp pilus assembly protein TadG